MIFDTIENLHIYVGVNPQIQNVIDFLHKNDITKIESGRVCIAEELLYANFDIAHGKSIEDAVLESHDKMIDIQIVIDSEEKIGWSNRNKLQTTMYDEDRDISFYPQEKPELYICLKPGNFAMFLPGDCHAPCISNSDSYRKVVFKLKVY